MARMAGCGRASWAASCESLEERGREEMRTRVVLLLCALFALTVGVATATAGGGNSANAKQCKKGNWQTLLTKAGDSFLSEQACVSYAAQGGELVTKPVAQIHCESYGGTFGADNLLDSSGEPVLWTCNGIPPNAE